MQYKFTIPGTDSGANMTLQGFKAGFTAHFDALGYEPADLDAVTEAADSFDSKLSLSNAAKNAAKNAVNLKDSTKTTSVASIREWADRVKSNPAATPAILASMGIVPVSAGGGSVTVPSNVGANPTAFGTCTLRWNANGNLANTQYVIEASTDGGGWAWLGNTTRKSFKDNNATPGVPKSYRVRAQRAGQTSDPSAAATIYGNENGLNLSIAA